MGKPRRITDCKTEEEKEAFRARNRERARNYRKKIEEKLAAAESAPDPVKAEMPDIDIEVESDGVSPITVCACPYCGIRIELAENTCHNCKNPIAWSELADSPEWVVCDSCGYAEKVESFAGACRRCGFSG